MSVTARQSLREAIGARRAAFVNDVVRLVSVRDLDDDFVRVRLAGERLRDYRDGRPADAFKIYLPSEPGLPVPAPGFDDVGRLVWPEGPRPLTRCFTVSGHDPDAGWIELDALLHPGGATERWVRTARPDEQVALTGWRTDFVPAPEAERHLLIGDLSARPAIDAITATLPTDAITIIDATELAQTVAAVRGAAVDDRTQVWLGCESGVARAVRRVLLDERGLHRDALIASAYWKRGEEWESAFDGQLDRVLAASAAGQDVGDPGVLQELALGS